MKITANLLELSARFTNCLGEREIDLRGNKIPYIENLAITRDQYDTIDLSDNELRTLSNFPTLSKLKTLLCSNNQIAKIDSDLANRLNNLEVLVLTNNRFDDFDSLLNLSLFPNIKIVSLLDNVVCKRPNYRLFVISRCANLRVLDFQKVTAAEREEASAMYSTFVRKREVSAPSTNEPAPKRSKSRLSSEHIDSLKSLIMKASSIEEVDRLERVISAGVLTDEVEILLNIH